MNLIDVSRTLNPEIAVWPGDTRFALTQIMQRSVGAAVNLTTLTVSAHTGTHIDAPHHYSEDATTVEALPLAVYWGPAQVVTVQKPAGPLFAEDFAHARLGAAPRLLVRSQASGRDPSVFHEDYVYPSSELADLLSSLGVLLYGTDAPSMDAVDSKDLPGHTALLRNGIAILEGLDLSQAADDFYELVALPLKIEGGDGSPVRAVLRRLR